MAYLLTRDMARQEVRRRWREIIPTMTAPAKKRVNGETSWICPLCGHGEGKKKKDGKPADGDGLTFDPKSKDGNGLKCFTCGFSGDIIDLYEIVNKTDYNTTLSLLAEQLGIQIERYNPAGTAERTQRQKTPAGGINTPAPAATPQEETEAQETPRADYREYYKKCRGRLSDPAAVEYLQKRGISIETATNYNLGYDPAADPANFPGAGDNDRKYYPCPRIIIPCTSDCYVGRAIDDTKTTVKKSFSKGSNAKPFNEDVLFTQNVQEVFLTEGAIDALSVIEAGAAAVGLNGADNADRLIKRLEQTGTAATIIICQDNDSAGEKATKTLLEGLQRLNIRFFIGNDICMGYKDPNEALTADRGAFIESVKTTIQEVRRMAELQEQEAQSAERERQQRTGAEMVDNALNAWKTEKYKPVPTGIEDLDKAIGGGFIRQQIILLGAAPGAGKTSFAQWIFEGMAKQGQSCIYLNLEMSMEQMLARSFSRIVAASGKIMVATEIMQGYKWDPQQAQTVAEAAEKYKKEIAPRMIYNPSAVTADLDIILEYIRKEAERAEGADLPVPCVVLDYLQIVRSQQREDDTAIIKRAMGELKRFAIDHNTFVFVIMANNRTSNKTGDVTMESGRDTSALEYGADLQLGLAFTYCLKKNTPNEKQPLQQDDLTDDQRRYLTLKITKGRWGGPGKSIDLEFDGSTMTYKKRTGTLQPAPQWGNGDNSAKRKDTRF